MGITVAASITAGISMVTLYCNSQRRKMHLTDDLDRRDLNSYSQSLMTAENGQSPRAMIASPLLGWTDGKV